MKKHFLLRQLEKESAVRRMVASLQSEQPETISFWAPSAVRPLLAAKAAMDLGRPLLVLVSHQSAGETWVTDLEAYGVPAFLYPSWETLPYERVAPAPEVVAMRLRAMNALDESGPSVVIASARAAMFPTVPRETGLHRPLYLETGGRRTLEATVDGLSRLGYRREVKVEGRGEFAVRGGIVDLFPPTSDAPLRIEFLGDEIESMRAFDPTSQRSERDVDRIEINALREVDLSAEKRSRAVSLLTERLEGREWLRPDFARIEEGIYFEGIESYLPFLEERPTSIFDYLPPDGLLVVEEPNLFLAETRRLHEEELRYFEEAVETGAVPPPPWPAVLPLEEMLGRAERTRLDLHPFDSLPDPSIETQLRALPISVPGLDHERIKALIQGLRAEGCSVVIGAASPQAAGRLLEFLAKLEFAPVELDESAFSLPELSVGLGAPSRGFTLPGLKLAWISQYDLSRPPRRVRDLQPAVTRAIRRLEDLEVGDPVVHVTHGIAKYLGLEQRTVEGATREYLLLEYAKGDKLYVPIDSLDRITKFVGGGDSPELSRLGGAEWAKARDKVRRSVKRLAIDLLRLYAERSKAKGHSYSPDSPWQRELEDSFPFEETPDQLRVVEEVRKDMEETQPMDRLVCGDVGYGKTEVAIRAAFKAVTDGKQVLVLVPTTLLAQQHFHTFSERLQPFPVHVEMLSRFRSRSEQKKILEAFSAGRIDILIGTHRLLQKDLVPKDLGLIIVDEEHRFGVGHKEQLKTLKKEVDVLTLTATPIPRTLQMAVSGIRDLSVIETPPPKRHPVTTFVGEHDASLVRAAIRRELAREGQVYYVHNRIEDIQGIAHQLAELVPEARIAVAHGQMNEHQLEKMMQAFVRKDVDVLLCTTIIESGLDIPAVNTLIVEQADRFGLAQLYQLRGRVGRAHHRAYAYFFIRPGQGLTHAAGERLRSIGELTNLGSGLKLALKDLEIRGAGSLLGAEQHGQIAAVGFELYAEMLERAVGELKGESAPEPSEVRIELPVDAYIPVRYIEEEQLRIEAYGQIARAKDESAAAAVLEGLKDRYGKPPQPVHRLLEVCRIKGLAEQVGVTLVSWKRGDLTLSPMELGSDAYRELRQKIGFFSYNSTLKSLKIPSVGPETVVGRAELVLSAVSGSRREVAAVSG